MARQIGHPGLAHLLIALIKKSWGNGQHDRTADLAKIFCVHHSPPADHLDFGFGTAADVEKGSGHGRWLQKLIALTAAEPARQATWI